MNRAIMILGYVKTYLDKNKRDNIGAFAAQAAFFIIMSAVPFAMLFTALIQYLPISEEYLRTEVLEVLPGYIKPVIDKILNQVYTTNLATVSLSAFLALWASGKALQYMTTGLNVINGIEEKRNWFVVRFKSIGYTLVFMFAIILQLVFMVFAQNIQDVLGARFGMGGIILSWIGVRPIFRGVFSIIIFTLLFVWLFTVLPNKKISAYKQIPGAVLCSLIWYVFSLFLSLYVNVYTNVSIYGSMATIMLTLFWLYSCMYFMLMCAEANVFFDEIFGAGMERGAKRGREKVNEWLITHGFKPWLKKSNGK